MRHKYAYLYPPDAEKDAEALAAQVRRDQYKTTWATQGSPLAALTAPQLAAIRAVILEVIDDGYYTLYEGDIPFNADEPTAHIEIANAQRLDFCDEIQRRIVARGAPATVSRTTISERRCKVCGELYSPDEDGAESICSVCATVRGGTR